MKCPHCQQRNPRRARFCNRCGDRLASFFRPQQGRKRQAIPRHVGVGLIAILFGGFGLHKFLLNKPKLGVLYLAFCWTKIPFVVAALEGIRYLVLSEKHFSILYL